VEARVDAARKAGRGTDPRPSVMLTERRSRESEHVDPAKRKHNPMGRDVGGRSKKTWSGLRFWLISAKDVVPSFARPHFDIV